MSFHADVTEGINAFTKMRASLQESPYESYYRWKLEKERGDQATQDALIQAQWEADHPGEVYPGKQKAMLADAKRKRGATAAPTPLVNANAPNPMLSSTAFNPNMASAGAAGGMGPGQEVYRRGGVIHAQDGAAVPPDVDDPSLSPEERYRRWRLAQFPPRAVQTAPPNEEFGPPDIAPRDRMALSPMEQAIRAKRAAEERDEYAPEATSPFPPEERTSTIGRALANQFGTTSSPEAQQQNEFNRRLNELVAQRQELTDVFRTTTPTERVRIGQQVDLIDQQIAALQRRPTGPAQPPPSGLPSVATRSATAAEEPLAAAPPPGVTQSATAADQRRARSMAGQPTPGGLPRTAAPPPTAPGQGVQTPGPGGGGAAPPPAAPSAPQGPPPQGSLWDPKRTTAFDPSGTAVPGDLRDPGNLGVVRQSGETDQDRQRVVEAAKADFNKAVNGGVHFAQYLTRQGEDHPHAARDAYTNYSGMGAMPAPVAQNVYKAWSENGRLDPGAALTRYMVYQYNALAATGHTAEANKMAYEVMQRLNIEASKAGGMAIDFLKEGNLQAATQVTQQGHAMTPDGLKMAVHKDGSHGVMIDEFTGLPTSEPFRITPRFILGAALRLANGTGMWNALAIRARQFAMAGTKPDRDAEGRALRNELTRQRIDYLRRKGVGGSSATSAGADDVMNVKALTGGLGTTQPAPRQALQRDPAEEDAVSGYNEEPPER